MALTLTGASGASLADKDVRWMCQHCGRVQVKRFGNKVRKEVEALFYCIACHKPNSRPAIMGIREKEVSNAATAS